MGLRLPIFDRNQGNIRAAEADVTRADAEAARVELALRRPVGRGLCPLPVGTECRSRVSEAHSAGNPRILSALCRELPRPGGRPGRKCWWPSAYFQSAVEYVEALVELRRLEVAISGLLLVDGLEEPPGPEREGGERISADRQLEEALDRPIGRRMPDERAGNEPRMD